MHLAIVIPSFFEGKNLKTITNSIENSLIREFKDCRIDFYVTDESLGLDRELYALKLQNKKNKIIILNCGERIGNQAAIIFALEELAKSKSKLDFVIVMDGDGEDNPRHVPILIKHLISNNLYLVLAKRGKRFTNLSFLFGKFAFNQIFRFLTGKKYETGNFSVFR